MIEVKSRVWGDYSYLVSQNPAKTRWDVVAYIKPQDRRYKTYHRDEAYKGTVYVRQGEEHWTEEVDRPESVSENEMDWTNVIIGRGHRIDLEFDHEPSVEEIENGMQEVFDNDDLFGFHVEPVDRSEYTSVYDDLDDDELFDVYRSFLAQERRYRKLLTEAERNAGAIWDMGANKFCWQF